MHIITGYTKQDRLREIEESLRKRNLSKSELRKRLAEFLYTAERAYQDAATIQQRPALLR